MKFFSFRRSSRRGQAAADLFPPSSAASEQRAGDIEIVLAPLHPVVQQALRPWLLKPTALRNRWPQRYTPAERYFPLSAAEIADGKYMRAVRLLWEEIQNICQTLDLPAEHLSELARYGVLAVHGIRLRQLERWLWPIYTAQEIKRMTAPPWWQQDSRTATAGHPSGGGRCASAYVEARQA